jgi:hypothetical protein
VGVYGMIISSYACRREFCPTGRLCLSMWSLDDVMGSWNVWGLAWLRLSNRTFYEVFFFCTDKWIDLRTGVVLCSMARSRLGAVQVDQYCLPIVSIFSPNRLSRNRNRYRAGVPRAEQWLAEHHDEGGGRKLEQQNRAGYRQY